MSGHRLTLRHQPALRIDARGLLPAALAALSVAEVERLRLPHGRESLAVGDLFEVQAGAEGEGASLQIDGDLSRFDRVGWCLDDGELRVDGSVGDHAGGGMSGGRVSITGNAGHLSACAMRGGWLEIGGDTGDLAASPLPGDMDGMRGGTLVVRGNAGVRLADRMRRGTVVVHGSVGDFAASRMVAGTVAIAGGCGVHPAWGMRRGSLVFATHDEQQRPQPSATFVPAVADAAVFWQLLARDLAPHGGAFAGLPARPVRRWLGDLATDGKGEMIFPQ